MPALSSSGIALVNRWRHLARARESNAPFPVTDNFIIFKVRGGFELVHFSILVIDEMGSNSWLLCLLRFHCVASHKSYTTSDWDLENQLPKR